MDRRSRQWLTDLAALAGWLGVILLWIGLIALAYRVTTGHQYGASDFFAYYKSARALVTGGSLYTGVEDGRAYIYPPLLATLIAPLTTVADFGTTVLVWLSINVVVLLVTLTLLSRTITRPRDRMAFWVGAALYAPTLQTLWVGQVSVLLLALTAGTWLAYRDHRPILAGVLIALAAWLKVYPGLVLIYFVWRRDWRVVMATVVSGVLLGLLQLVAVGPNEFYRFATEVLPGLASSGERLALSNNAILGFAYRLVSPSPGVIPLVDHPALFPAIRLLVTLIVVGGAAAVILRPARSWRADRRFDLEYGLVTLLSMLLGTLNGVHTLLPALLVFFLLLRNTPSALRVRYAALAFLAGALAAFQFLMVLGQMPPDRPWSYPALLLSMPFFALMILWLLLIREDARPSGDAPG